MGWPEHSKKPRRLSDPGLFAVLSVELRQYMAEGEDFSTNSLEVCPTSRQHAFVVASESSPPQNFSVQDREAQRPMFGAPDSITLIVFSAHAFVVSQSNWPERKEAEMKETHLNQLELAVRWRISHRTLERWRWTGEGPKFLKVGGRVVYRLSDVEEYEQSIIRSSTSDPGQVQQTGA
jgi:hypothetical protein